MKIENDKLKEKLQETSNELKKVKEAMKEHRDGGHIEITQDANLPTSHVRSGEHGELIIIIIIIIIIINFIHIALVSSAQGALQSCKIIHY